jgi:hypothetical protein
MRASLKIVISKAELMFAVAECLFIMYSAVS